MLNIDKEREEYILKLDSQINGIEKILKLNSNGLIKENLRNELQKIKEKALEIKRKLKNNEFEIAIVGLEKSGKSSFANAFIENNILPTDDERCTYTSTCIKYGYNTANVVFYSVQEFNRSFREKLELMNISGFENMSYNTLSIEDYKSKFEGLPENIRREHEDKSNEDISEIIKHKDSLGDFLGLPPKTFTGYQLEEDYFQEFIRNPAKARAVKEITICSDKLENLKNAIIYDVPGFNSPTKLHEEQSIEKMKKADAIILIAKADEPSLTDSELKILRRNTDDDGINFTDKLFVFANKADRATNIDKNMVTIKNEFIEKRKIISKENEDRIFFGSAKAHLQAQGKLIEQGTNCLDTINSMKTLPNGDGIEAIRNALELYNETVRFQLLKIKINKINNDVKNLFSQMKIEYLNKDNGLEAYSMNNELLTEMLRTVPSIIEEKLKIYRNEVRTFNNKNKLLTKKIIELISNLITNENYDISLSELQKQIDELGGVSGSENVEEVDIKIRKYKFEKIYSDFYEQILNIANNEHKECYDKILNIFLESFEVTPENYFYEEIKKRMEEYLSVYNRNNENGYYKCLIERFSRDIFEILIYYPYGGDARLHKFLEEIDSLFSLAVFYRDEDISEPFWNVAPKNQPLIYMLLFHEYGGIAKTSKEAITLFKQLTGIVEDNEEIFNLIKLITQVDVKNSISIISTLFDSFDKTSPNMDKLYESKMLLNNKYKEMENNNLICKIDISDKKQLTKIYKEYHSRKGLNLKEYSDVISEFSEDIKILKSILLKATVSAINIEKPFIAYEIKRIDDILKGINNREYSAPFYDFIQQNINYIKSEEYKDIEEREAIRKLNTAIVTEIDNILLEMK